MAEITAGMVKELRELTGLGMMECKKALEEAGGDIKKAEELVRKIGENITGRRFERVQSNGKIVAYVHPGAKVAVLVDLEGDEALAKDIAMHIAFAKPEFMSKDQVAPDRIAAERKVIEGRA